MTWSNRNMYKTVVDAHYNLYFVQARIEEEEREEA